MRRFRTGLLLMVWALIATSARAAQPATAPEGPTPDAVIQLAAQPIDLAAIFGGCAPKATSAPVAVSEKLSRWTNWGLGGPDKAEAACSCGGTCGLISGCNCDYCDGCSGSDCTSCCTQGCKENCNVSSFGKF